MEVFESKNAQSKHTVRTHSNRRGNLPAKFLSQLYFNYKTSIHDVAHEIKLLNKRGIK